MPLTLATALLSTANDTSGVASSASTATESAVRWYDAPEHATALPDGYCSRLSTVSDTPMLTVDGAYTASSTDADRPACVAVTDADEAPAVWAVVSCTVQPLSASTLALDDVLQSLVLTALVRSAAAS